MHAGLNSAGSRLLLRKKMQKNRKTEKRKNGKNRQAGKQENRKTEEQKNRKTEKQKNGKTEKCTVSRFSLLFGKETGRDQLHFHLA